MTRSEIIDYIKAFGAKFTLGSQATYDNLPDTDSLADPDIPAWANVKEYVLNNGGSGSGGTGITVQIDFTDNLSINWQTAKPSGYTQTYATLFGNFMPDYTFWSENTDDSGTPTGVFMPSEPQMSVTVAGIITNVNFTMPSGYWRVTFYGIVASDVGPVTNNAFPFTFPFNLS